MPSSSGQVWGPPIGPGSPIKSPKTKFFIEPRYQIVALCFFATFTAYVERVGFSIAYTEMAKAANVDEAVKGGVLSAFFWGYGLSQVPGGWAAQRLGGHVILAASFFLWSTASLLTPGSAHNNAAISAARVFVGIAQGMLIPSVHTVLSQWIPPHERARAVSLTTSGMYLGSAAAMLILPSVAAVWGPASLLRLVGALGFFWLALWLLLGRDIPNRQSIIPLSSSKSEGKRSKGRPAATPWLSMMRHPALWAIVVNNFTFHYAFYVVMNWLPTYFDKVLHASLSELGGIKTAPYLIMFATSNLGGWLGDYLITTRRYAVVTARRAVNTAGFFGTAASLLFMPAAGGVASGILATSCTLGFAGLARGGFSVNHMDIAPKYAGVVMGISNTAGTLSGVIGVAVTGFLLERGGPGLVGWWEAFSTSALLCLLGSAFFLVAARGDRVFGETDGY